MYFNTTRWAIDIMLSIGFIFVLTMILLIKLIKLETKVLEIKTPQTKNQEDEQ